MASGTLLHKPHLPWCNLVVLWFLSNLDSHRGWSMVWMDDIPVYWLCPRLVRPCWCIHKKCGMGGNISMASSPLSINPHTTLGMAEQSVVPAKNIGPTYCMVYDLDGCTSCVVCCLDVWYPCVLVATPAFRTLSMHPQEWGWQGIHDIQSLKSTMGMSWWFCSFYQILVYILVYL